MPNLIDEAKRVMMLARGDSVRAFEIIERQLAVLVLRTQVLLSLSGIVITVTGFSGRAIAQTSHLARTLVASGITVVLLSATVAIGGVLRLRWLTEDAGDLSEPVLVRMLEHRNAKSRALSVALVLFVIGFSGYVVSIALMLISTPPLTP